MPYKKKKNPYWYVRVPTRNDGSVQRSTHTTVKGTAKAIERILSHIKSGKQREYFDLIDAVHEGRLTLLDLWEYDGKNELAQLRERLAPAAPPAPQPVPERSIASQLPRFERWLRDQVAVDTARHYVSAVLTFLQGSGEPAPAGTAAGEPDPTVSETPGPERVAVPGHGTLLLPWCPASALTIPALYEWLNNLQVAGPTKRKYHAAMRSFVNHLIRAGGFTGENPMDKVPVPPAGRPRTHYLETQEAIRLVEAFTDPEYRAFNALMAGSGTEVSAALELRRRDVYLDRREVRAPGTKTYNRNRIVRVAEWAWPYIEARLPGLEPDDKLFPGIPDRWIARDVFVASITPLAEAFACYRGYTMRDHRHTYAVRAARAGTPPQLIAAQLGHVNAVLVLKVYGQFFPNSHDRDRWEMKAAELDAKAGISYEMTAPPPRTPASVAPTRTKIEWPEVPTLLEMLTSASTKAVADRLGISDAGLRKHLKARGVSELPDGRRSGATRARSAGNPPCEGAVTPAEEAG